MATSDSQSSPPQMVSLGIAAATRAWDCLCAPNSTIEVHPDHTTFDPITVDGTGALVGGDGLLLTTAELRHALGIWEENEDEEIDLPRRNTHNNNVDNINDNTNFAVKTVKRKDVNRHIFQVWKALFSYGLITVDELGDAMDSNSVKDLFLRLVGIYGNPKKVCPPVWTKPIAPCETMWREQYIESDVDEQSKIEEKATNTIDGVKISNGESKSSSGCSSVALSFASIYSFCKENVDNMTHEEGAEAQHQIENMVKSVPAISLRNMRHLKGSSEIVGSYDDYQALLVRAITEGKNAANTLFYEGKFKDAIRVYKEALLASGEAPFALPLRPVISVIYSNISQAELNLGEFAKARRAASTALKFNPQNEKAKSRMKLAENKLMISLDSIDKEARTAGLKEQCGGQ
eukprot:Tbor_TRINITY_DN5089_c0_g1::TRINITY_DN5089_c0_g1_i1::g.14278::m.14278